MAINKDIVIVSAAVVLAMIALFVVYSNYHDDEREIYTAFFKQFKYEPALNDAAFMSFTSDCGASHKHIQQVSESLFTNFRAKNSKDSMPVNISNFSYMVNVVGWEDTLRLHNAGAPHSARINSQKNIILISRIGFDEGNTMALMCFESSFSANIILFKKMNSRQWEIVEHHNIWVT